MQGFFNNPVTLRAGDKGQCAKIVWALVAGKQNFHCHFIRNTAVHLSAPDYLTASSSAARCAVIVATQSLEVSTAAWPPSSSMAHS